VFLQSGWRAGAGLNMAFYAFQLCVLLLRGPHCERFTWFGYQGGIEPRKKVVEENMRRTVAAVVGGEADEEKVDLQDEDVLGGTSRDEKDASESV